MCALFAPSRLAKRGGSRSSRTSGGMRWTRMVRLTSALSRGRRSRVVLAPLCRRQVRKTPTRRADDGVNKAIGPRGERGRSRKTIAWGMPDDSGASAVNTGVHPFTTLCAHQAVGASSTRHPPRPLFQRAIEFLPSSRAHRAAECESMFVMRMFVSPCAFHALSAVIVRLDRTIQYSGTPAMKRIGRGVLDARLHGHDSGGWGARLRITRCMLPSLRGALATKQSSS